MKNFKKVISLFVAMIMIFAVMSVAVSAAGVADEIMLIFTVDGKNITIIDDHEVGTELDMIPSIPEKEGYTAAWSVTDFTALEMDTEVKAIYTPNAYTVTYMANGVVIGTVSVAYGEDAVAPVAPEKLGFTVAWDNDGKAVKSDLTINAVYTAVETNAPAADNAPVATDAPAADLVEEPASGCGSAVSFAGIAIVAALGTCTAFVAKKKD